MLISFVLFLSILTKKSFSQTVGDVINQLNEVENRGRFVKEYLSGDEYYDYLRKYFKDFLPVYPLVKEFPYSDYRRAAVRNLKERTYEGYVKDRNSIDDYYAGFIGGISYSYPLQPNDGWSRLLGKYVSGVLADKVKLDHAFVNKEVGEFYAEDSLVEKLWSLVPLYCNGIENFKYDESQVNNTGDEIYHHCRWVSFQICCHYHHCHYCYIIADCVMEIPLAYRPVTSSLEAMTYIMVMEKRRDRAAICGQIMAEIKSIEEKSQTGRLYDYEGFVGGKE